MLAATLTLLSPRAALLGTAVLVVLAATVFGQRRAGTVRRVLRLPPPPPGRGRLRLVAVAAFVGLLALSAAQPALTRTHHERARRDVQVLFVFDISRSMAASARLHAPTRLDRAATAANRLRAAIPSVSAGVASLSDRVLPDLFPVPDRVGFAQVVARSVAIENPPPQSSAVRATSYTALERLPGSGYFDPRARTRVVVVLTDGESSPVQTGEVAAAFAAQPGYHVLFVRFWRPDESIYDADGHAETAYRPDPSGRAVLASLAGALHGSAYEENELGKARERLQQLVGTGPATELPGTVSTRTPLAPFTAGLALLAALALAGSFSAHISLGTRGHIR